MKTTPLIHSFAKSAAFRFPAVNAAMAMATAIAQANPDPEPKPYTLFMGADVAVAQKSGTYPLLGVAGPSWVVGINGRTAMVTAKEGLVFLKITPGLKLTEVSASIENLTTERSFSPGSDPYAKFTQQTNQAASDAAQAQFAATDAAEAEDAVVRLSEHNNQGSPGAVGLSVGGDPSHPFGQMSGGEHAASLSASVNVSAGSSQGYASGAKTAFDTEAFDAMDVRFEVSAEKPLNHPYVVLVGRYRSLNGPAGIYRNWIHSEALKPIGSNTTRVRILGTGLPAGFEMKDLQVHLYDKGEEVATNVASNRVPLTRDEAFEYVKTNYLSDHPNATLPAAPAMGKLPADLPSRLAQGQFNQAFYVKVSKDGVATDAYEDEACSLRMDDPYLEAVLKNIRFEPALQNGKPVDGVAKLKLGKLVM
jgi:hypothetical protein